MTVALVLMLAFSGFAFGADKAKEPAEARKAGQDALAALCKVQPSARAAAKAADKGAEHQGAASVSPGVLVYPSADKGLALELTAKGTRYYKDAGLN